MGPEPALEPSSTAVPCSLEGGGGYLVGVEPVLEPTSTLVERQTGRCRRLVLVVLRLLLVVEPMLEPDKPLAGTGKEGRRACSRFLWMGRRFGYLLSGDPASTLRHTLHSNDLHRRPFHHAPTPMPWPGGHCRRIWRDRLPPHPRRSPSPPEYFTGSPDSCFPRMSRCRFRLPVLAADGFLAPAAAAFSGIPKMQRAAFAAALAIA
jgi:hypothetical protein